MAVSQQVLGPIINISMAGLAFRYMNGTTNKKISDRLGIFLGSDNILIEELTTQVISDKIVSSGSTFLQISTRQRSIQFINLTKQQRIKLEDFISNKTLEIY
ncbi:MAG: hypothetical protein JKY62_13765 [Desulfocapsa sp.]|uniref:PilZ domain-containing protein n=1 Tax=Desulfotalea psychrophila TaxID=84980 RepID=A0ABS3AU89_9BACT|nr:hypothetical protein [Desulfocapsa sp.]MBN4068661.1 hypothetical protein [Desulfotalea psychrophila]